MSGRDGDRSPFDVNKTAEKRLKIALSLVRRNWCAGRSEHSGDQATAPFYIILKVSTWAKLGMIVSLLIGLNAVFTYIKQINMSCENIFRWHRYY
ncbi:MAG: hypothetical protein K8963_09405 [Proteobacteria bacterium]|nr:hypothetical protein [Pseudomonadota bacterium]